MAPTQDQPGYFIDAENVAEMARLTKQAQFISDITGLFPAGIDLTRVENILDIGCGPGTWALEVAKKYPSKGIMGVDISQIMTTYANSLVAEYNLTNASFQVMDARQPLDLPDGYFDLIHLRFISFPTRDTWPTLIQECFRLLAPGGYLIDTEGENLGVTTSPSLTRYNTLLVEAARRHGQCWTSEGLNFGITAMQRRLFSLAGFINIHEVAHVQNASAGMPMHEVFCENWAALLKLVQPLLVATGVATQDELTALHARMVEEIHAPDFCHTGLFQTVWGEKPKNHNGQNT